MSNILVVEDSAMQSRVLSLWLQKNGHSVVECHGGNPAREFIESSIDSQGPLPNLIITDINMPEGNGLDLVRWVREEMNLELPIMILSSRCDQEELGKMLQEQRIKVIPKPFSPSRIMTEIEKALTDDDVSDTPNA